MEKKRKVTNLVKNTLLFGISTFGSKILVFLFLPLYTDLLTTTDYGTADAIVTTTNLLVYIFTLNIADGVLRFAIEKKDIQGEIFNFGIKVIFLGSTILAILIILSSRIYPLNWNFYCYFFLLGYFFVNAIYSLLSAYLRAINQVKSVAIASIISISAMLIANIVFLVVLKIGLLGYLIALVLGPFISAIYCFYKIIKSGSIRNNKSRELSVSKEIIKYCIPLAFNGICWWINNSIDKYFIIYMLDASHNGIYSAAGKISAILLIFQTIFIQAWSLSAITDFDFEDKDGFFTNTYEVYKDILVMVCFILNILNIPIAKLLFARGFYIAWQSSVILVFATLFSALGGYLGSIFSAAKNTLNLAITTVAGAIINVIFNILLIPHIGIKGAAIATTISFFSIWIVRVMLIKNIIHIKMNIIRDAILFILLIMQIYLCEFDNHYYIYQIIIGVAILFVIRKTVYKVFIRNGLVKR